MSCVPSIAQTSIDNEKYFTELDGVVGDGDFGISLTSGFGAILAQWEAIDLSSGESFLLGWPKLSPEILAALPVQFGGLRFAVLAKALAAKRC